MTSFLLPIAIVCLMGTDSYCLAVNLEPVSSFVECEAELEAHPFKTKFPEGWVHSLECRHVPVPHSLP